MKKLFKNLIITLVIFCSVQPTNALSREQIKEYNLGEHLHMYITLDRGNDWYIDQGNTGRHSKDNCGPSVSAMITQFYNKDTEITGEKARETIKNYGGWWTVYDVADFLKDQDLNVENYVDVERDRIKLELIKGNLMVMCIDTTYLPYDSNGRINRFYDFRGGHFVLIKGYLETDKGIFYEVYDPNSFGKKYYNEDYQGKNRYFTEEDLFKSAENNWNYIIVVSKPEKEHNNTDELESGTY